MRILTLTIIIVTAIFLLILGYGYTLKQLEIEDVSVYKLSFDDKGFNVQGHVEIHNGGFLPLNLQYIDYRVEAIGRELAKGEVEGRYIWPGESAKFPIEARVGWKPTAEAALAMLEPGQVKAQVVGTAHIDIMGFETQVPFSKEFNIEEYLKMIVQQKAQEWIEKASRWVGRALATAQ